MIKVDSKKTVHSVANRFMKVNKGRNLIAIIAIIMTTVMFTSLFSALLSMMKSTQQQEFRMNVNQSHITAENLTYKKFTEVAKDEKIAAFGCSIMISQLVNEQFVNSATEMRYADKKGAEAVLCTPTQGRMPEKYDEIALRTITLDILDLPRKVGTKVKLQYTLGGKKVSQMFVLSGYWKGDPLSTVQNAWVSKAFCQDKMSKAAAPSLGEKETEGAYTLYIWCEDTFHLTDIVNEMEKKYHISDTYGRIYSNSAYDIFAEDSFPFDSVLVLLLIIFASGYLIIYNIFRISVNNDIRTYGLLKNIGTTGRQLKSIVRRQALTLSVIGIPLGLAIGYFIGLAMTPYLLSDNSAMGVITVQPSINPLIFIASASFAALTIYIGCQMPARIVAKVSPVDAVRINLEEKHKKSGKKTGKITPFTMAFSNMKRSWKRAVLVVISLALPMTLLNASYSLTKSFDYDQFLNIYASYDFDVSGITNSAYSSNMHAVSPEFIDEVTAQKDTEKVALIYNDNITYPLDDKGYENLKKIIDQAEKEKYINGYELEKEKKYLENREAVAHVMGLNREAYEKMKFIEEGPSYEEFAKGDYVIVSDLVQGFGTFYDPGDKITLELEKGKEYTVLAIGWMPYDLTYRFGAIETIFDCSFYLPVSEYTALGGSRNAMMAGIDVKDGKEKAYDQWLTQRTKEIRPSLYVESRLSVLDQCRGFAEKYYMILGLLSAVLFVIGLLNFFNTSSVTIMARRRELALLEAVGQTQKQIRKMLITEGLIYLLTAVLLADTAGMAIARPMILNTVGRAFFFNYHPSLAASFVCLPLMALIAVVVPIYNYRRMSKEAIVERLRND